MKIKTKLLENIGALPYRKIITFDNDGTLKLNGRYLEPEQAIAFRQGAIALRDNYVRKVVNEQKKMLAIELGVHNGLNTEMIEFSKACLWDIQEDENILNQIIAD